MSAEDDFDRLLERSVVLARKLFDPSFIGWVVLVLLRQDGEFEEITELVPRHGFTNAPGYWDEAVMTVYDRIDTLRAAAVISLHSQSRRFRNDHHVKIWMDHAEGRPREYRMPYRWRPGGVKFGELTRMNADDHPGLNWP